MDDNPVKVGGVTNFGEKLISSALTLPWVFPIFSWEVTDMAGLIKNVSEFKEYCLSLQLFNWCLVSGSLALFGKVFVEIYRDFSIA